MQAQHLLTTARMAYQKWGKIEKNAQIKHLKSPASDHFEDHYFSQEDGLGETRYVFLEHNHLAERFSESPQFHIGETGFGTGLSFCLASELFLETAPKDAQLHFFSCEKFPLKKEDERLAWHLLPENAVAQALLEHYPNVLAEGHHCIEMGRIMLHLLIGDALSQFQQVIDPIDAWFLDGFAPKLNPDMWSENLFKTIAALSYSDTTFATYTAAGDVRRGLIAAGFDVQKGKGYGKKREMLFGKFGEEGLPRFARNDDNKSLPNWYARPKPHKTKTIAIIGAGITGTSCAYELCKAGFECRLYDSNPIASGASGNPLGLVRPHLTRDNALSDQFLTQGALLTLSVLEALNVKSQKGVLQLAVNNRLVKRYEGIANNRKDLDFEWLDAEQASKAVGHTLEHPGMFISAAAMISPPDLCSALIDFCRDKVTVVQNHISRVIARSNATRQSYSDDDKPTFHWELSNGDIVDAIVLCNASEALQFEQCQNLPLKPVVGDLSLCDADSELPNLKVPLCYEGYALPAGDQKWILGATFRECEKNNRCPSSSGGRKSPFERSETTGSDGGPTEQQIFTENMSSLCKALPTAGNHLIQTGTRTSTRCVSPDHMPLVGPLGTRHFIHENYQRQALGDLKAPCPKAEYLPNFFTSLGHGSKGLSSALLSAKVIRAYIEGSAMPVHKNVLLSIHPSRFWIRELTQGQRHK